MISHDKEAYVFTIRYDQNTGGKLQKKYSSDMLNDNLIGKCSKKNVS